MVLALTAKLKLKLSCIKTHMHKIQAHLTSFWPRFSWATGGSGVKNVSLFTAFEVIDDDDDDDDDDDLYMCIYDIQY